MDTAHEDTPEKNDNPSADEQLPPLVAYQVGEESREGTLKSPGTASEQYRRGRVEAETRRISDEVTLEAQKRRLAERLAARGETGATAALAPSFPPVSNLPTPKMIKRLFVPLDGTSLGERALPYAATLAGLLNASVLLGHVTPTEPPALLGHLLRMEGSQRQVAQQAFAPEALPYLREQGKLLATGAQSVDTIHITAPSVAEGLLQIEKAHDIDLVVVALGVHSETNHMRFGRVADSLIRSGAAPVLVIPPDADALVQPFVLRHVLVTLDGSTLSEQALGLLMGLLAQRKEQGGEAPAVTLMAVAEDYAIMPDYQSYLDALRGTLSPLPAFAQTPLYTKVIIGSASGAIVGVIEHGMRDDERGERGEAITSRPVDLLIMTTHGRGGLSRWLLGSVAGYVLPRVHIPVLLNRPGAPVPQS